MTDRSTDLKPQIVFPVALFVKPVSNPLMISEGGPHVFMEMTHAVSLRQRCCLNQPLHSDVITLIYCESAAQSQAQSPLSTLS